MTWDFETILPKIHSYKLYGMETILDLKIEGQLENVQEEILSVKEESSYSISLLLGFKN